MAEQPRRIIHVKGVGRALQAPDQVTISIELTTEHKDYSQAVGLIADKIAALRKSVVAAGFDTDELKTEKFYINPTFDYEENSYRKIFKGYAVEHRINLTFDFITEKFNKAIAKISDSLSNPNISVSFSIKDTANFKDVLLKSAAENARHQAEILTAASGVKLGKLASIGCAPKRDDEMLSATEINALFSDVSSGIVQEASSARPDTRIFIPEDIEEEIAIDFYWEIED